jgi:hypothetical protein
VAVRYALDAPLRPLVVTNIYNDTVPQNSRPREKWKNPHQKTNKNSQRKKFVA